MPITHVDATLDKLKPGFTPRNAIEAGSYRMYDPLEMNGLPIGVQVIGRRLEEEKVMEGMRLIAALLKEDGLEYKLLNI